MAKTKSMRKKSKRRKPKKKSGCALTALFSVMIIIMIVLIGIVGYLYLKESNWFQIRTKNKQQSAKVIKKSVPDIFSADEEDDERTQPKVQKPIVQPKKKMTPKKTYSKQKIKKKVTKKTPIQKKKTQTVTKIVKKSKLKEQQKIKPKYRKIKIYLTKYDSNRDKMILMAVSRTIKNTDSPLRDSLDKLLIGPTDSEDNAGYTSSIPGGVKILSLSIKNGIAYINLNQKFEFGTGTKLMRSRVYQIVYTATQFPSVHKVQILINGQKKTNFAGEHIDISHPLSRLRTAEF